MELRTITGSEERGRFASIEPGDAKAFGGPVSPVNTQSPRHAF